MCSLTAEEGGGVSEDLASNASARRTRTHGEVWPRKVCPRLLATPEHPLLFPVPWGTVGEHPELSGHPSDTRDPVSEPELLPELPEAIKWGR